MACIRSASFWDVRQHKARMNDVTCEQSYGHLGVQERPKERDRTIEGRLFRLSSSSPSPYILKASWKWQRSSRCPCWGPRFRSRRKWVPWTRSTGRSCNDSAKSIRVGPTVESDSLNHLCHFFRPSIATGSSRQIGKSFLTTATTTTNNKNPFLWHDVTHIRTHKD